jgi:hypothetical protein
MQRVAARLALFVTLGCAIPQPPQRAAAFPPENDKRPCARNFQITGNVAQGLGFKTFEERAGADTAAVFQRAEQALAAAGYGVTASNRSTGVISSQTQATRVALNFVVTSRTGATRIDITAQMAGGLTTAPAAALAELCELIGKSLGSGGTSGTPF